jgi:hypothetical protein
MPYKKTAYKYRVDKKMKWYGYCDFENTEIKINPTRGGLINTIVHEEIHRKHPDWLEKKVIEASKKVECKLTIEQSRDLLDNLIKKIKANKKYGKR